MKKYIISLLALVLSSAFVFSQNPVLRRKLDHPVNTASPVGYISAYGGSLTVMSAYKLLSFYNTSTLTLVSTSTGTNNIFRTLKVGGGGSGGSGGGTSGGGGGGGLVKDTTEVLTVGNYSVIVGLGGVVTGYQGFNGDSSYFNGKSARGGGYGAGYDVSSNGGDNGTGGGGSSYSSLTGNPGNGGIGISGFNGGSASAYAAGDAAGGGAGAGESGKNATLTIAGRGGAGLYSDITGVSVGYGGGGGGSCDLLGVPGDSVPDFGAGGGNARGGKPAGNGIRGGGGGGFNAGSGASAGLGGNGLVCLKYPHPGITASSVNIFSASASYSRWDGSCVVRLLDGTYLMGVQVFGTGSGDFAGARIEFYTSTDLLTWSYLSRVDPDGLSINTLLPCLKQRLNGDIVLVYYELVTTTTSRILQRNSTDGGLTWSSLVVLRENSGEYLSFYPREIFKTNTGRWLQPFEVAGNGDLIQGPYTGYTMYSDDEGVSWSTSVNTITVTGGQCLESGYISTSTASLYIRYFRTYNGYCYMANTSDDGISYGSPYDSNIPTINLFANSPSTTTIKKLAGGNYISFYNNATREYAQIAYSFDGNNFSTYYTINYVASEQLIEADIVEKNGFAYIYYSISSAAQTKFSLYCYVLKLSTY